jgi:hypothetical protein
MRFPAIRSEVPFRRTLVRLATRLALGPSRAHYHSWRPHLAIDRDSAESAGISYKGRRICRLRGTEAIDFNGGEIYLIGSGPSINTQNIKLIPSRTAILLNGSIALLGESIASPLAITIEDERFVWRHFALMKEKIPPRSACLFSPGVIRAICELDSAWLQNVRIILIDDLRKPYLLPRRSIRQLEELSFVRTSHDKRAALSLAPARGVIQAGSVVVSALQFAISLKPNSIGLFGIDISNANQPRFYETGGHMAKSGLEKGLQRIIEHIVLAKKLCEENGIALTNHSPVSALLEYGFNYDNRFERDAASVKCAAG